MKAKIRRKLEMGTRALGFSRAHPDASAGYTTTLARLQELLARAEQLGIEQNGGVVQVHTATARKRELRKRMLQGHLDHLHSVARDAAAAGELPELAEKVARAKDATAYLTFRALAGDVATIASANRELLVGHGLSELVLDDFEHTLDRFDGAVEQWNEGRRRHVGATDALDAIADAVVDLVEKLNGINRLRFAPGSEELAAWRSASNVAGPFRSKRAEPTPATPPLGGEAQPAA